jgi:hypothetical protein
MVGAILALGCGGGDGDKIDFSGGSDNGSNSASKDNGDSNSADEDNGESGEVSEDADDYASAVCGAISEYADEIEELSNSDADFEDPEAMKDMMDQAVPVLEGISKDLDKIKPPSEVGDWHEQMVSGMSMAADLFSRMGEALDKPLEEAMADLEDLTTEMADVEDPFGTMQDLPAEYQAAFESNPDCEELQNLEFFE